MKHGLHAKKYTENDRLQALIEKHLENPDPTNLLTTLAKAEALFEDWLDRFETYAAQLDAWHRSYAERGRAAASENKILALESLLDEYDALLNERGEATDKQETDLRACRELLHALKTPDTDEGKPRRLMDIADGHKILLTIAKITDSINKKDARLFISRKTFVEVMKRIGFATRHVLKKRQGKVIDPEKLADEIQEAWGQVPMV